jgi:hypothetical protein
MCRQDGREHGPVGAADVHDRAGAIKRQGGDRGGLEPAAGQVRHGAGESAGLLGVVRQPGEERLAVQVLGRGTAGADGVDELSERRIVRFHPHDGQVAHRARLAAGQRLPERGQGEDTGLGFGEHARAGQRAQQAVQGRRVGADTFGEGLHRCRAGHELIGDAQGRGGIQSLGDPEPAEEFNHPHGRRRFVSLHGSPSMGVADPDRTRRP